MSYLAYLRLDGIAGECADAGHKGWMAIDSFNQNICGPQDRGGRTTLTDFAVSRLADRATPLLARAAADSRHFREAILELCLPDGPKTKYMEIRLTNVRITSYGLSGAPQNDTKTPYENMMLQFEKVEWIYFPDAFAAEPVREPAVSRADWSNDTRPLVA